MDMLPALQALVSAGCKAVQNTLGAGSAWCVGYGDVVALFFIDLVFGFMHVRLKRTFFLRGMYLTKQSLP